MTALLYATVYAPDNLPTEVAHIASKSLGTVNEASDLEYKKHLRGSGALKISINRHHAQAALLVQDRYLIVHGANGPVGGGFLDEATVDLSHTDGPGAEFLIWTGMGQMGILRNGRMDATSNIAGGHAPIDGYWALDNQGNMAGASNGHAIPMLKRALVEMQLNSPPGISVVDHSSWTYDLDTDSVAVPFIPGEVQGANVGDDALSLLAQMSQLGDAIFVMDHLFKLDAHLTYGTDKSGAFGAGTVRFEKSINVAAAIQRKVRGAVNRTHLIVGGAERTFITAVDPAYVSGDVVRWGFLSVPETADPDGLEAAGLAHLAARKRQTDTFTFPQHDHGDAPANGIYEPGDHYDVGDTVSHHTGSGDYDANEQASPVAAISWVLKTGDEANGDYEVTPEIGSTFHWDGEEAFTGSTPGSQHRILLCPFDAGVIEMDTSWKVLNVKGVAPPTGWNRVGFDDAAWASAAIMTGGAYVMSMGHLASDALTPSDEIVLRKEFYIEPEDLGGAAVTFKYALDNAGKIYVNGTQIVSLGPDFTNTAGHYTSDHATTLARSTFRAGFNVVAIYVNNDAAGSVGATPPGAMSAGIYININTTNGNGTSKYAQRCDRHYHASDIDENNYGNVQAAIDNHEGRVDDLETGGDTNDAVEATRAAHGRFVATYHRASDTRAMVMFSDDGLTFRDGALVDANTGRRDPSLIHWDGKYWVVLTHGSTSLRLYSSTDLETWSGPTTITVDAGATQSWAPEWIRNMDGTPYLHPSTGLPCATVNVSTDSETTFTVREIHPTNRTMTTWSAPVAITGTGLPAKMIDAALYVDGDDYWLWYKEETSKRIEIAHSATALTSGYTVFESADWAGWFAAKDAGANSIEGPSLIRLDDGRWRVYFNENNGFDSIRAVYSETTDDWRTGTSTWTTQAVITTTALMSHGTVTFIPGVYDHQRDLDAHAAILAGIVTDHGALTGLADDDHTQYLNAARHTATAHLHVHDDTHFHIVDEQFNGDGATTVFTISNEAEVESAIAYVAGVRTSVTVGGSMNDQLTFAAAPASGTDNISVDYVAVAT